MVSTGFCDHEELPFIQGPKASTVLLPQVGGVGGGGGGRQRGGGRGWQCRSVIHDSKYITEGGPRVSYSEGPKLGSLLIFSPYLESLAEWVAAT